MSDSSGRLELIIGNMFSGKSTELIRRINKEQSIDKRILVINYLGDNRYSSDSIATHNSVTVKCLKVLNLYEISFDTINEHDSFFIDEGQFFLDLYPFVIKLVDVYKKHVIIAGLDGDSNRHSFGSIIKLIPICDTVDKLTAYCKKCNNGTIAPFSMLLKPETGGIGGSEKYMSVCRNHYLNSLS
jgi:thymidine kinase